MFIKDLEDINKFLTTNKDIIVTSSDKGNTTVILDKNKYINEKNKLLEDPTYKKLTFNLLKTLANLTILCKNLKDNSCIDKFLYEYLHLT